MNCQYNDLKPFFYPVKLHFNFIFSVSFEKINPYIYDGTNDSYQTREFKKIDKIVDKIIEKLTEVLPNYFPGIGISIEKSKQSYFIIKLDGSFDICHYYVHGLEYTTITDYEMKEKITDNEKLILYVIKDIGENIVDDNSNKIIYKIFTDGESFDYWIEHNTLADCDFMGMIDEYKMRDEYEHKEYYNFELTDAIHDSYRGDYDQAGTSTSTSTSTVSVMSKKDKIIIVTAN
jgi:hypothetical protein